MYYFETSVHLRIRIEKGRLFFKGHEQTLLYNVTTTIHMAMILTQNYVISCTLRNS